MRRIPMLTLAFGLALAPLSGAAAQERGEITVEPNIEYATRAGEPLLLDAYLPASGNARPAVIWIHGGKWAGGDKADPSEVEMSTTIASHGFAVFSVNYSLAWKGAVGYPAAVEDLQRAVEWIRGHAADFGIDPDRIAAAGNSAGGHLAALLATLGEGSLADASRISAALSLSGPMDLEALLSYDNENVRGAVENFLGCSDGCEDVAREASPITHVDPSDAPVFLANSDQEAIPLDQATSMADALGGSGVPVELIEVPGTQHGWGYWSWRKAQGPTNRPIPELFLGFLGEHLNQDVQIQGAPSSLPSVAAPTGAPPTAADKQEQGEGAPAPPVAGNPKLEPAAGSGDTGSNTGLIVATAVAVGIAAISLAMALVLLRRVRSAPTPPDRERDDDALVDAGSRRS
jgi:acetyl esterase